LNFELIEHFSDLTIESSSQSSSSTTISEDKDELYYDAETNETIQEDKMFFFETLDLDEYNFKTDLETNFNFQSVLIYMTNMIVNT